MAKTIEKTTAFPNLWESAFPSLSRWGWRPSELIDVPDQQMMRIEETRENGNLVIRAELPGINAEKDVDISLLGNVLTIQAERREKREDKDAGVYRSEFRYGSFARQLSLPRGCSLDDVKASYENGILEVKVPMNGSSEKPVKVKVQTD